MQTFFVAIVIVLLIVGYFFIYKKLLSQADEDEDAGPSSPGSAFGVFLLFVFLLACGFNYLYSLLDPWDPRGLYQHNRTYMGIVV
jgi:hypothetical protein